MFYLIDKPVWFSSFDIIRKLRKALDMKRIGHAGTLDPLASGCLLIATANSTKLLPLLDGSEKTYIFSVRIDGTTASLDLGTEVIEYSMTDYREKSRSELHDFLMSQTQQIPPRYSALHIWGERAYDLARKWEDFEIQSRQISVSHVEIVEFAPPLFAVELRISSGGYIRSFAPLIGEFFGVSGGYVTALRRTAIHTEHATLSDTQAIQIEDLDALTPLPLDLLFPDIENIEIDAQVYQELREWRIIAPRDGLTGIIGKKYFLNYQDIYASLVEYSTDGFTILRNDI
jgi:tRNA pseudouridine55 synthase